MAFHREPARQAQEVVFLKKPRKPLHPNLCFKKYVVEKVETLKH